MVSGRTAASAALVAVTLSVASPRVATAQAWLPAPGEGSVSVLYQNLFVHDHFLAGGGRVDRGQIQTNDLLFDITYGLTDRMTVTFAVPYVQTRYTGSARHPSVLDDGRKHGGFQDLKFGVRYNVADGPITVTPFVGVNMPSHAYEYFAHAALGTRVREVEIGTYVGRVLSPRLPNAFVQTRYSYAFAETIAGIDHSRSSLDVEAGYFVRHDLRVFLMGAGQKTHGGIDTPDAGWRALPPELGPHHDRLARLEMLDVGAGAQFSLTPRIDLFGSFIRTLAGRNAHALSRGVTIGASWSFGGQIKSMSLGDAPEPPDGLPRCLCQKK
jgi:hypothetical protein